MEVDSMHATIERQLKNKTINVPMDYVEICKSARKRSPYSVEYLTHTDFKSTKSLQWYSSIRPGYKKGDPVVTNIRALKYTPDEKICYKLQFSAEWMELPHRKRISNPSTSEAYENLPTRYKNRLKIKKTKYDDLQALKKTLPVDYHTFYDNIPFE